MTEVRVALTSGHGTRRPSGAMRQFPITSISEGEGGYVGVCISKLPQAVHLGSVRFAASKLYCHKNKRVINK